MEEDDPFGSNLQKWVEGAFIGRRGRNGHRSRTFYKRTGKTQRGDPRSLELYIETPMSTRFVSEDLATRGGRGSWGVEG